MGRFIIIVLDGFGVGEMPDVEKVRPADIGANTCAHIYERVPDLRLPALESLGLGRLMGKTSASGMDRDAACGRIALMHDGADTFFGHQEIMGTRPKKPFGEPIANKLEAIRGALAGGGFAVRDYVRDGRGLLVVEEAVTVGDNIECDPGQAFNVTAATDLIEFERVRAIGGLVRGVSVVPRVITFGGRGVKLDDLLAAVEVHGDYIGVNAPASGVYGRDYQCVHLGYGVDPAVQAPSILGKAGIPVFLLGKAADVIANPYGSSIPMVDTDRVLGETRKLLQRHKTGFFCANVQETDLCGHGENAEEYARKLQIADRWIGRMLGELSDQDILIVMADHGNDPTIGHPHHTRELVPFLVHSAGVNCKDLGIRPTLSDVGATACAYFGVPAPENGSSLLPLLKRTVVA